MNTNGQEAVEVSNEKSDVFNRKKNWLILTEEKPLAKKK